MKLLKILALLLFAIQAIWATSLTFTFANGVVTNDGTKKYEFDVMAAADNDTTRLGDALVYINYNTLGFGSSIYANSKITVGKGTLLQGELVAGLPLYEISNIADNSASRVAIGIGYKYPDSPTYGNAVPTSPTQLIHVAIEIADTNQTSGLSFEQSLMVGQQYFSDNSTKFSPIVASDTDDSPLKYSPSALEDDISVNVPRAFKLQPNFPNPFNPSTTLRIEVPFKTNNVQLVVYDVLGKKVATLFSGEVNMGTYKYVWNGHDQSGRALPTGVYFAVLKAPDFSQTIKMMLVK